MSPAQSNTILDTERSVAHGAPEPAQEATVFPLALGQESLWFVEELTPGTAAYNMPEAWRLRGHLDRGALQRSLDEIVRSA